MDTLDLKGIMSHYQLDEKKTSSELFPKVQYPVLAFRRILKGDALLDSDQISKLALMCGTSVGSLFKVSSWGKEIKNNVLILSKDNYRAEIDLDSWVTRVFHEDSIFHEEVIHRTSISLSSFVSSTDALILNHSKNL